MDSSNNGGNNDNRNIKGNNSTSFGIYKNNNKERGGCGPSMFVKVNMDGIPIGRKIDLNAHLCYQTLARALEEMFSISYFSLRCSQSGSEKEGIKASSKLLGGLSEFVLTYEDRDGDWMLVGDVPWGSKVSKQSRWTKVQTRLAPSSPEGNKTTLEEEKFEKF
ncbi:Auxin-responsive protein IAA11 [Acorus calamus]|uniref:Auxin-responsive protein n=1 Tax=Acorus calamus TaxID=4465 RepID=A0AAV9CN97_ACOCL|nr:Auxin-responsive protein IAA11 [Acorus calamus]